MVQYLLVISRLPVPPSSTHSLCRSAIFNLLLLLILMPKKGCRARPKGKEKIKRGPWMDRMGRWVREVGGPGRNRLAVDEFICVKFKCKYLRVLKGVFRGLMLDCYAIFLSSLSARLFVFFGFGFGFGFWDLPLACHMILRWFGLPL